MSTAAIEQAKGELLTALTEHVSELNRTAAAAARTAEAAINVAREADDALAGTVGSVLLNRIMELEGRLADLEEEVDDLKGGVQ